jgi:hypothetical protein
LDEAYPTFPYFYERLISTNIYFDNVKLGEAWS